MIRLLAILAVWACIGFVAYSYAKDTLTHALEAKRAAIASYEV